MQGNTEEHRFRPCTFSSCFVITWFPQISVVSTDFAHQRVIMMFQWISISNCLVENLWNHAVVKHWIADLCFEETKNVFLFDSCNIFSMRNLTEGSSVERQMYCGYIVCHKPAAWNSLLGSSVFRIMLSDKFRCVLKPLLQSSGTVEVSGKTIYNLTAAVSVKL